MSACQLFKTILIQLYLFGWFDASAAAAEDDAAAGIASAAVASAAVAG